MKTYKGRFHIGRPMNDTRKPRMIDIEVTRLDTGRSVVEVSIDEADVPRMLMGGASVPCDVRDYRDASPIELQKAFKAGVAWQENLGALQAPENNINIAAKAYAEDAQ